MIQILKITIILSCFSLLSLSMLVGQDQKVTIDFYFESLCPYCNQYIEKSLKIAASTKDFWQICDFKLYPYGNARRSKNGTSWSFNCQHGSRECQGNLIQTCVIKKYDLYSQALPFIICLQADTSDFIKTGTSCAEQLGLNWDTINSCATSQQGIQYENQMGEITDALQPAHQYVPWIVVNGKHSQSTESAVISDMVSYVCHIYTGSVKIDACS